METARGECCWTKAAADPPPTEPKKQCRGLKPGAEKFNKGDHARMSFPHTNFGILQLHFQGPHTQQNAQEVKYLSETRAWNVKFWCVVLVV